MLNKEEIEKAKQIARDYIEDTPIAPYNCLMNEERKSVIILLDYINNSELIINKLKNEIESDKMEQFDDYVIYLQEKYLDILKGNLPST